MPTLNEFRYTTYSDPIQGRASKGNLITLAGSDSNQYGRNSNSGITVSTTVSSLVVPVGDKINVPIVMGGTTNEGEYILQIGVFQGNRFIEFYNSGPTSYYGTMPLNITLSIPELPNDVNYSIYYQVQPTSGNFYKRVAILTQGESTPLKITTSGNIPVGNTLPIITSGTIVKRKDLVTRNTYYSVTQNQSVGTSGLFQNEGYTDYFPFFSFYSPNNTNGEIILRIRLDSNFNLGNLGLITETPKLVIVRSPVVQPTPFSSAVVTQNESAPGWTFEGALALPQVSDVISASSSDVFGYVEYRIPPPQKGNFLCILSSGIPYVGGKNYTEGPSSDRLGIRLQSISSASVYVKNISTGPESSPLPYKEYIIDINQLNQSSQSSGYILNATLTHTAGKLALVNKQIPRNNLISLIVPANYVFTSANIEITDGKYYVANYNSPLLQGVSSAETLTTILTTLAQQTSGGEGIYLLSKQEIYQSQVVFYWQSPVVQVLTRPSTGVILSVSGLPDGTALEFQRIYSPYGPNTSLYEGYIKNNSSNTVRAGTYKVGISLIKDYTEVDSTFVNLYLEPPPI